MPRGGGWDSWAIGIEDMGYGHLSKHYEFKLIEGEEIGLIQKIV